METVTQNGCVITTHRATTGGSEWSLSGSDYGINYHVVVTPDWSSFGTHEPYDNDDHQHVHCVVSSSGEFSVQQTIVNDATDEIDPEDRIEFAYPVTTRDSFKWEMTENATAFFKQYGDNKFTLRIISLTETGQQTMWRIDTRVPGKETLVTTVVAANGETLSEESVQF